MEKICSKEYIDSLFYIDTETNNEIYYEYWSGNLKPGAYDMTNFISATTTTKEFDDELLKYPEYKLHFGGRLSWTVLQRSILISNEKLSIHIACLGGEKVLNTLGAFDSLPLFDIIIHNNINLAKIFIENGAIVNIGVKKYSNIETPIFHAIISNNLKIAKLLLENGAILNKNDIKQLNFYNILKNQKILILKQINRQLHFNKKITKQIPDELIHIIVEYLLPPIL